MDDKYIEFIEYDHALMLLRIQFRIWDMDFTITSGWICFVSVLRVISEGRAEPVHIISPPPCLNLAKVGGHTFKFLATGVKGDWVFLRKVSWHFF